MCYSELLLIAMILNTLDGRSGGKEKGTFLLPIRTPNFTFITSIDPSNAESFLFYHSNNIISILLKVILRQEELLTKKR